MHLYFSRLLWWLTSSNLHLYRVHEVSSTRDIVTIFPLTSRAMFCILNDVSNKGGNGDDDDIGNNEKAGCL